MINRIKGEKDTHHLPFIVTAELQQDSLSDAQGYDSKLEIHFV